MYIKKSILIIASMLSLSSLNAMSMCGEDLSIGDSMKGSAWTPRNTKSNGLDLVTYESRDKNSKCKVYTKKDSSEIVKYSKTTKTKAPGKPPVTISNAKFKYGEIMYYDNQKKKEEIFSNVSDFRKNFTYNSEKIRFARAEYESPKELLSINVMCTSYGKDCSFIISSKAKNINESYHPRLENAKSNRILNEIVEKQQLELIKTNGWR